MKTLTKRLENIQIELEYIIKEIAAYQNTKELLLCNNVLLEYLKDLHHILVVAQKIIEQALPENVEQDE